MPTQLERLDRLELEMDEAIAELDLVLTKPSIKRYSMDLDVDFDHPSHCLRAKRNGIGILIIRRAA